MLEKMKIVVSYKDRIRRLVIRDLRGRYKGSVFGFLWNLINPLAQIIVYTIVFSFFFKSGIEKYYLYLGIGMIAWNMFQESLTQGTGSIVANSGMVSKIYFPREILPISAATSRFINMLLAEMIMILIILLSGHGIRISLFPYLLVVFLLEYFLVIGITIILSGLNVYLRDMEYIVSIVMFAWIWITPVMYESRDMQMHFLLRFILNLNPMTAIINALHDILYYQSVPDAEALGRVLIFTIFMMIISETIFIRLEERFVEEL